jgi:hypothetical protein
MGAAKEWVKTGGGGRTCGCNGFGILSRGHQICVDSDGMPVRVLLRPAVCTGHRRTLALSPQPMADALWNKRPPLQEIDSRTFVGQRTKRGR